ncbi:sugar phosphate isomerase/epimerase family protein [Thermococcus sp.]|uniref:sugar phosphate isomerase/epimerase family protein n=1 Tax=Thermococcus sp. TaxID=35749 RepID=UPI002612CE77|nr:sugar phosphate isomerase/epimerase family protein [Thermococcus sp.]
MIGLSTTACLGRGLKAFEGWLKGVKKLGFGVVELVSEWPSFLTWDNWKPYSELLESYSLAVTIHAPFSDVNIGSLNSRIREASLEVLEEAFEVSSLMNALNVTVHPGHCSPASRKYRDDYNRVHRESLSRLEALSREYGVTVGVENMPSFPILDAQTPERLAELMEGIGMGVTFDVGHLNTTTRNFEGFLRLFRGRIVHVHLHDNSGKGDEHLALGEGTVPWKKLLPKLPGVPWVLEVASLEDARRSLGYLRGIGGL